MTGKNSIYQQKHLVAHLARLKRMGIILIALAFFLFSWLLLFGSDLEKAPLHLADPIIFRFPYFVNKNERVQTGLNPDFFKF